MRGPAARVSMHATQATWRTVGMTDSFASRRSTQWLVIAVCAAVAVVCSAEIALGYPREYAAVRIAAYSVTYLIAGSVAWIRRPDNPIGPVMLATSVAGSLSFFGGFGDPIVGRVAGAFGSLTNLFGIWLILAAPTGRLVPGAGRLAAGRLRGHPCARQHRPGPRHPASRVAFGAVTSLLIAGVVFQRWKTASGASRRALTPVMIAGVTISIVHAIDFSAGVLLVPITRGSPVFWASIISRTLVPFGYLLGLLRLRMAVAWLAMSGKWD